MKKFQRNWTDHNGNTSLHLAVDGGNPNILSFCLDKGTPITLNDDGISFFDKIIDKKKNQLAEAALQHPRWEECLDNTSPDRPHCLVRIVDDIPEVYGVLLDQCFSKSSLDRKDNDYWEEFNFKGVTLSSHAKYPPGKLYETPSKDDLDNIEMNISVIHAQNWVEEDNISTVPARMDYQRNSKLECCRRGDLLPFAIIRKLIESKHNLYLLHPVVEAFIRTRWSGFHKWFYRVKIFIHFILALMLTVFLTTIPQHGSKESNYTTVVFQNTTYCEYLSMGHLTLLYAILVTSLPSLLICLAQIIHRYLNIKEVFQETALWINFIAAILTIIYICSLLAADIVLLYIAAIAACFTWLSVGFDLQVINVGNIGMYITIIMSTTRIAFKVLSIIFFLFLAFSVPLHILVGDKRTPQFSSFGLSVFSIFNSLFANLDVTELIELDQTGELPFPVAVFMLVVAILILLPIITINVLIGLAVGDIDKIKKNALISQRVLEIRVLAHLDHIAFPKWLFKRHSLTHHRYYPNHRKNAWQWITRYLYHYKRHNLYTEESEESIDMIRHMLAVERKVQEKSMAKLTKKIEEIVVEQISGMELTPHSKSRKRINTIVREDTGSSFF